METDDEIYFYGLKNEFGFMSNFYRTNFIDNDGIKYNCSEQYFMYQKCKLFDSTNTVLMEAILTEKSPSKIKRYGRKVENFIDDVWNDIKFKIMLDALRFKFNQNDKIKQKLIKSKPKILYEASKYDNIWGICFSSSTAVNKNKTFFGKNLLGIALMTIRDEF